VLVNLTTNATDGSARGITISGFENIIGTDYGDDLTGDDGPNTINPLHGSGSTTSVATGGPDRLDGKGGIDTLIIDFSREDCPHRAVSHQAGPPVRRARRSMPAPRQLRRSRATNASSPPRSSASKSPARARTIRSPAASAARRTS
jgi:hypothetical protein